MRFDLQNADHLSSIGTFLLTVVIVVLMVWPMVWPSSKTTPPPSAQTTTSKNPVQHTTESQGNPMTGWILPVVLALAIVLSAWLHLKAARVAHPKMGMPPGTLRQEHKPIPARSDIPKNIPKSSEIPRELLLASPEHDLRFSIEPYSVSGTSGLMLWIFNDRVNDMGAFTITVRDIRTFDARKSALRDSILSGVMIKRVGILRAGCKAQFWFAIMRPGQDHVTLGDSDSNQALRWPNADVSKTRTWHMTLSVTETSPPAADLGPCEFPIAIDWVPESNTISARSVT